MHIAVCALLYGNNHKVHRRFLRSLEAGLSHAPQGLTCSSRFWCNTVPQQTLNHLSTWPGAKVHMNPQGNCGKSEAMRPLFKKALQEEPDWLVWFDDDTWISRPQRWLLETCDFMERRKEENLCYFGDTSWQWQFGDKAWEFITSAPWYRNRPAALTKGERSIRHAKGAYYWLRADVCRQLDWPDQRLYHRGLDSMLAEAVRQQGLPMHHYCEHVIINDGPRREGLADGAQDFGGEVTHA